MRGGDVGKVFCGKPALLGGLTADDVRLQYLGMRRHRQHESSAQGEHEGAQQGDDAAHEGSMHDGLPDRF